MRGLAFAFLAVLATAGSLPGDAVAQGPGSYVRPGGPFGGPVQLIANYYASDTCQAALGGGYGAPPGQSVGPQTVPYTVVIGPNPRGCGKSRVVTRAMAISGPASAATAQIFFVNTAGRVLKVEKVGLGSY